MASWIFQGNPSLFDIDGYLHSTPGAITWLAKQHAKEIAVGDTVYLWRSQGGDKGEKRSGVIASAEVTSPVGLFGERIGGASCLPDLCLPSRQQGGSKDAGLCLIWGSQGLNKSEFSQLPTNISGDCQEGIPEVSAAFDIGHGMGGKWFREEPTLPHTFTTRNT